MRSFFKTVLAVIVAILIINAIIFFVVVGIVSSAGKESKPKIAANSVLRLDFSKSIPELTDNVGDSGSPFAFSTEKSLGLTDYLELIKDAAANPKIKGIYLDLMSMESSGMATTSMVRKALEEFKASGKFIYAYADSYSQKMYYVASVADKIYLNPRGAIDFRGLGSELTFFKGMLDKVGIKADVFYCGKFKSATEPFRRTDMSPENKVQVRELIEDVYGMILNDISRNRNIPVETLRAIAYDFKTRDAQTSLDNKMIDGIKYKDEVIDELRAKLGTKEKMPIPVVNVDDYFKTMKTKSNSEKLKVAVVYFEGNIMDSEEHQAGTINGEAYARLLRKLRADDNIKAVVLRVNSGGGSALASELIWREVERLKQSGRVVVTSMGDVAASGGYYIASNSDMILAQPNTITGSIGVFGMIPHGREMLEKKLGITMDTVKTGKFSAFDPFYYEMNAEERLMIQSSVDTIYKVFKTRVSEGRHMPYDNVEEIAQGRVWTGRKAREIGLVDSLGTLQDAINIAATKAGLSKFKVKSYPQTEDKFEQFVKQLTGGSAPSSSPLSMLPKEDAALLMKYYEMVRYVRQMKGVQMRMPFDIKLN